MKKSRIISPMTIGFLAGAAIGVTAIGMGSESSRKRLKKQASRTARSMGDLARDITEIIRD